MSLRFPSNLNPCLQRARKENVRVRDDGPILAQTKEAGLFDGDGGHLGDGQRVRVKGGDCQEGLRRHCGSPCPIERLVCAILRSL